MDLFNVTIDKEELVDLFDDFETFSNFCDDILSMPSADAVEVVRCKDCKYHKRGVCEVENYFVMTDNDFYCARGEKE